MRAPGSAFVLAVAAVASCAAPSSRDAPTSVEASAADVPSSADVSSSSSSDASSDAVAPVAGSETASPASLAETRLGWPEDRQIAGVYANIDMIGAAPFKQFLGRLATNGMNAVVVDGKDYQGWLTYPSTIPLAVETHASHAVLKSLPQLVHEAHQRGIRVLLRVACFHDPWTTQRRRDLAIAGMVDWLDPNSDAVQSYLVSVVDETLSAGVDEIQLDYVRYPTEGIGHAKFALGGKSTTDVITGFVQRVHARTAAAGVPLSIDIFGVVAWQRAVDVKATGQDLAALGAVVEAVSPMVYPSHFQEGFNGYAVPGAHPEVVAFGTKQAVDVLRKAGSKAVVRPWIQAFPWHAPGYDTSYVIREIAQARGAEGVGWLGWNAGGYYGEVMAASWATRVDPRVSHQ